MDVTFKATLIAEREQNPYCNPMLSWNGGGYHQPHMIWQSESGMMIEISDTSCGDFGRRYSVSAKIGKEEIASYYLDEVSTSTYMCSSYRSSNPLHREIARFSESVGYPIDYTEERP